MALNVKVPVLTLASASRQVGTLGSKIECDAMSARTHLLLCWLRCVEVGTSTLGGLMGDSTTLAARTRTANLAMSAGAELPSQRSEEKLQKQVRRQNTIPITDLSSFSLGSLLPPGLATSFYEVYSLQRNRKYQQHVRS